MAENVWQRRRKLKALKWLANRGGAGPFMQSRQALVAAGERAPIMKPTWLRLMDAGLIDSLGHSHIKLADAAYRIDLDNVVESGSAEGN